MPQPLPTGTAGKARAGADHLWGHSIYRAADVFGSQGSWFVGTSAQVMRGSFSRFGLGPLIYGGNFSKEIQIAFCMINPSTLCFSVKTPRLKPSARSTSQPAPVTLREALAFCSSAAVREGVKDFPICWAHLHSPCSPRGQAATGTLRKPVRPRCWSVADWFWHPDLQQDSQARADGSPAWLRLRRGGVVSWNLLSSDLSFSLRNSGPLIYLRLKSFTNPFWPFWGVKKLQTPYYTFLLVLFFPL